VDLKSDAQKAATQGVAGALNSGAAINYAARSISPNNPATYPIAATTQGCLDAGIYLLQGGLPSGYGITGTAPNCTVTNSSLLSAAYSFTAQVIP
jgi:MSHA pilin protein MshA